MLGLRAMRRLTLVLTDQTGKRAVPTKKKKPTRKSIVRNLMKNVFESRSTINLREVLYFRPRGGF